MTTMTVHPQDEQRYGQIQYGNMTPSYQTQPQPSFTNPWPQQSAAPTGHALYAVSPQVAHDGLPSAHMGMDRHSQQSASRLPVTAAASMASYGSAVPVTTASAGSPPQLNLISMNTRIHGPVYSTSAPSPVNATYTPSPTSFEPMSYPQATVRHGFLPSDPDQTRRYSQSSVSSSASFENVDMSLPRANRAPLVDFRDDRGTEEQRQEFASALEASQGMMSMKFDTSNQETPRAGVYNPRAARGAIDSYGFPTSHSVSSSVSSAGFSPGYYSSVDGGSTSDYSTAGSDIEPSASRALPRPQGLMVNHPPAPQSMMTQFSSKVSSNTQKKHKCKVCDKRFTRPSSLQTHMYSHTGEKPFKCEVEGCGRNFSVVSNLRRHRKVHKGSDARSETGSEDRNQSD